MWITKEELNPHNYVLDEERSKNFDLLFQKINAFRMLYDNPMIITSGVRSVRDQSNIDGKSGRPVRLGSAHIKAAACDIRDPDGKLQAWVKEKEDGLKSLGLCFEDFHYTPGWVHVQVIAVPSGKFFFIP